MSRGRRGKDGRSMQVVHVQVCDAARRVSERRIVLKIPRGSRLVRVQFPPPAPFDAAPTPSRASLMARQPSWAEANVLSERSESKGSQQLDPLHTLTAIVTRNSPVRGAGQRGEARAPRVCPTGPDTRLSLIHISEPTRLGMISY